MKKRKECKKYYFSVEGETEKWYFEWLQKLINSTHESLYKVSFNCKIQKNPLKRAKDTAILQLTKIWHISDYESNTTCHIKQFKETIDNLKKAEICGKQIEYEFGYSNLTFDLWMILHKKNCGMVINHRSHYIRHINEAYEENFEDMHNYKHKKEFERCLSKLSLHDVITAVNRAETIMKKNKKDKKTKTYKHIQYYEDNPALLIHVPIKKILNECGLM